MKKINLFGVTHSLTPSTEKLFKKFIELLDKTSRKGQTVGLELPSPYLNFLKEAIDVTNGLPKEKKINAIKRTQNMGPEISFFYRLLEFCSQKGLNVFPIESSYGQNISVLIDIQKKMKIVHSKENLKELLKLIKKSEIIKVPIKEKIMIKKIKKLEPDIVIVGSAHVKPIMKNFNCNLIMDAPLTLKKLAASLLAEYARRKYKKFTEAKKFRRKMKFERMKKTKNLK